MYSYATHKNNEDDDGDDDCDYDDGVDNDDDNYFNFKKYNFICTKHCTVPSGKNANINVSFITKS